METDSQEIAAAALLAYQQQQLLGSSGLTGSSINFSPTGERLSIQNLALNQLRQLPDGSSALADQRFLGPPFAPTESDLPAPFRSSTLKEANKMTMKAKSPVVGFQSEPMLSDGRSALDQQQKERGDPQKRPRHEELLNRTRETMIRKTGKKVKQPTEIEKDVVRHESPQLPLAVAYKDPVSKNASEFPLPPMVDQEHRTKKVSLASYRLTWQKLGGYKNKELFQKMVQNGAIPIFRPKTTQFAQLLSRIRK
jgi:hypothetical protein